MENRLLNTGIGITLAVALTATPSIGHSEEGHGHHEMADMAKPAGPEMLAGVWQDVKARETELQGLIRAKELSKVHETAFAIRDLVAAMPAKSAQLGADQQKKLAGNVKFVATLAERLDTSGDAGDQTATEANFKQLQSVLKSIEALYPAEQLK